VSRFAKAVPETIRQAQAKPMLRVDSEPSGADVFLGDTLLGQTPYAGDNEYPPGKYRLRLVLPGHQPFAAQVEGGRHAEIRAQLKRK
jgi:hypothetical protein